MKEWYHSQSTASILLCELIKVHVLNVVTLPQNIFQNNYFLPEICFCFCYKNYLLNKPQGTRLDSITSKESFIYHTVCTVIWCEKPITNN